jgi:hypothetical protein
VNLSAEAAAATEPTNGKRTIRLVPKNTENDSTQKTPKPSDPTVNLQEVANAPGAATTEPSTQTVKMPTPDDEASKPASAKRTLKLKPTAGPKPPETSETGSADGETNETMTKTDNASSPGQISDVNLDNGGEPSIIFTLVALVTLGLLAYYAYLAGSQWMTLNG